MWGLSPSLYVPLSCSADMSITLADYRSEVTCCALETNHKRHSVRQSRPLCLGLVRIGSSKVF